MKCHCLILCALAVTSATAATSYVQDGKRAYGQVHDQTYTTYLDHGPGPLVDAHGVPQDTPEVQAAKAEHFAAHASALALANKRPGSGQYGGQYQQLDNGHYQEQDDGQYLQQQQQYQSSHGQLYSLQAGQDYHHIHKRSVTYNTPYQLTTHQQPLVTSVPQHSVPIDTPEVQQAKTAHFLAHSKASQGTNSWSFAAGGYPSQQQTSSLVKFGITHDTQGYNAGAQGYNAGAQYTNAGYNTGAQYTNAGYNAGAHYTNAGYNTGAQYTNGGYNTAAYTTAGYNTGSYNTGAYNTGSYSNEGHSQDYNGGYYVPTLTKQGVPEDTPEVKAAKAQHFLALAKAQSASLASDETQYNTVSQYGQSYSHGQEALPQAPAETPEVQQAKAAHFAAHAAERARQTKYAPVQAQAQPVYTSGYSQGQSHGQAPHY